MAHRDLVSGIQKGDRDSFNDLCEEVLPALMAYARAILPDEWADDAVQDVLFSFWKNRKGLDPGRPVLGYLMRAVYNRAMNYLRKENLLRLYREWNDARIAVLGMEGADPDHNPVMRNLFEGDLRRNLEEAIAGLPPRCQEVFRLSYIDGLPKRDQLTARYLAQYRRKPYLLRFEASPVCACAGQDDSAAYHSALFGDFAARLNSFP